MAARFCASCGHRLNVQARFCSRCGSPVNPNAPISRRAAFVPAPASHRQSVWILTVVVVITVIVVAALFVVPLPRAFGFEIVEHRVSAQWSGEYNQTFPIDARVSGAWNAPVGTTLEIQIEAPDSAPVYLEVGSSGSFSFRAEQHTYSFVTESNGSEAVSVSGTYSMPLL